MSLSDLSVLVIEDDPADAHIIARRLRGSTISVATSRTDALAILADETRAFDAILLDLGLPDGAGIELLETILAIASAPVLALTGRDAELSFEAQRLGAQDFLCKGSAGTARLEAALMAAIARYQAARDALHEARLLHIEATINGVRAVYASAHH